MDQETVRLIVTASATLVAALSGAGITAVFNRMNTRDTLDATAAAKDVEYAELRQKEHESWLRAQRQQTYSDFVATVDSVLKEILDSRRKPEAELLTIHDVVTHLTRLRFVSTDDTNAVATSVANRLGDVLGIARQTQQQLRAGAPRDEASETSH